MAETDLRKINFDVKNTPAECVSASDRQYIEKIDELVSLLCSGQRRIILLAGPSGSGKTTTANIIKDKLISLGHSTSVVSMDNFYRSFDDPAYPRDEKGELDYEAVESLRCDLIHDCIGALTYGETYYIPRYVFSEKRIIPNAIPVSLTDDGFVIIEGIHALNPIFTSGLPLERIMRLFISVSTNVNLDGKRLLSGRKIRFIRRMTRDSIYRATNASQTLSRWESVLRGEDKYLYPFKPLADFLIDTFHSFELGAMKPFANKAIGQAGEAFYGESADIIKNALACVEELPISFVTKESLIREFIPGGIYESLY